MLEYQLCLFPCSCLFAHAGCSVFVRTLVLQEGPGGFLHWLLVSNRAQHSLRVPGEDTHSGETQQMHNPGLQINRGLGKNAIRISPSILVVFVISVLNA